MQRKGQRAESRALYTLVWLYAGDAWFSVSKGGEIVSLCCTHYADSLCEKGYYCTTSSSTRILEFVDGCIALTLTLTLPLVILMQGDPAPINEYH